MIKDNSTKKRMLSFVLALALIVSFLPINYIEAQTSEPNYAEDEKNVGEYRDTQLTRGEGPTFSTSDPSMDFKDGFRYQTLEPSATSPDKTKWGIEFEFDKDQGQRTYTDFVFTNSGNMATYLNTGNIPSNDVGVKIAEKGDFKEANYKAESEIIIDGIRTQRNLNLYATVKDLEHINSIENENTTIGWKGNYSKDASNQTIKATQGESSSFSFTVNPWPNENDQLSLITLTGSHNEKVFVKGQTLTTNVTVSNLDASARERLVGQVYHPETGQVVPGASAHINDQDKIVIEMPKGAVNDDGSVNKDSIFYKDKSYTGLQNLRVKFFARPRTADEFQAATGEYGVYISTGAGAETISHKGKEVVIDKQGIARYDHYNLIGEFSLNLDDTKYHDQDYIDEDGVKASTSEVSYVRAGIPYIIKNNTQESTDDITDAVGRKHASASLDTSFLDRYNQGKEPEDQWKIESNNSITEIKITPPKSAKALDYMPFSIRYTYTNGSVDVHKVSLIVKESGNNIPQYYSQVLYPTETETSIPHLSIKAEDQEKRRPVEYTIEKDTYTDDHGNEWTASIDTESGIVTVKPKDAKDFIGGEKLVVPVTAHYVEEKNPEIKFTEEVRAAFVIKQKENLPPRYDAKNGKAGETLTSTPIVKKAGEVDTRTPARYSIEDTEYTDNKGNKWTVSIDEKTGIVTANIPNIKDGDKLDGTIISVPVTAHYLEDGQDVGTREATAHFLASGTNNRIEHTEKVPFDVKVEVNNELPKGEWRYKTVDGVEQKGQAGEVKTTWTIENSKIVDIQEERKDPVYAIIEVGNKDFEGTLEYVDIDPIPFETEVTVDPSLAPNVIEVDQAGKLGEQETKVTRKIKNGEAGEEVRGETTRTKEPVTRKIRVGSNTKGRYKETEIIPFKTEVKKDPSLKKGEWKYAEVDGVQQTGENGLKERTVTIENSLVTEESEYKTIKEPKNAVILVGDEDFTGKVEYIDKDPVPFETEVTIDTNLEPNKIVEDQAGVLGEQETKVTREIKNGEAGEEVRGETIQTKDPVNRKIRIGAKSNGTHEIKEVVEVPFEVEIQFDDSLAAGEQVVSQEGVPGEKTRNTTLTIENGKVINTEEGEFTQTKAPTKKIIKVGRNTEGEVKHVEELPFKYTVNEVNTLKKGEYEIVKPGKVGTKTTTWTIKNSEVVGEPKEVIVESEDAIINVGMGTNTGTHEVVEKVPVPFETIIEFDDNIAPGEQKVSQEGKLGEKTRTNTLTIEDGVVTETKEGEYEQNITPVNRVIKVGRNTEGKVEHKEELPFKYTIQYDPELEAGKYVEETPGRVGERITTWTIKNSEVVGEPKTVETKPVDAVIKVGNKDFTGEFKTTKTEAIEFETEYKVNNELKPGEVKVVQEGKLGEKETLVTHTIVNGQVTESVEGETKQTKDPVKRIVEVGPGTTNGTHTYTSKKPFEVEVRVNPELPKGEYKVVQKGVEGEEEYTITIENSKVTNTSEPKQTKAPVKEIIEVGNADFTGTVEYVDKDPIPFETEVTVDSSLKPGEVVEDQKGELGEQETKVTRAITNGEAGEPSYGKTTVTKEPVNRKIRVGSQTDGQYKETETIPFEIEVRKDPSLKKGEWKYAEVDGVQQKGESGLKERTITIVNSQVTEVSEYKTTREAKNAVILVGDEDFTGEVKHTKDFDIPFEVEVRYNDDLPAGTSKEIQKGEKGSYTIEFKQNIKNGQPDGEMTETELKDKRVEPKKHIIEIGRKVETPENNYSKDVEVEIEYVYDDTKDKGVVETGELIPGKVETKVVDKYNPETGKVEQTVEEVVTKAKQIIVVGTKDLTGKYEYEVTTEIPFEVEVIEDDTLEKGRSVVEQEGKPGNKTTKYEQNIVNGKPEGEAKVLEEKTNEEPIKHIIRVGTKSTEGKVIIESEIPYEVEVVEDSNLEAGKTETRQEGSVGKKVTTVSVEDNKEQSREEVIEKDPVKKIIAIGTKKVCEIPLIPLVPAETKSEEEPKDPETPGEETPREEEPKAPEIPGEETPREEEPKAPETPGEETPREEEPKDPETPGEKTPETPREQEPGKPGKENPNKPDNKKPESNNASNPRTGDDGVMYIGVVALIAVVVLLYVSKKKNKNEQ
ncbi:G5 domain-containing protein [Helcococcus kunzii]|nr:G5 domain-containing protein [Helcococcus kunzii]MCT1797027.1 G5 domain-containing protein [Helcococcus kunzii]MCT1989887.1 G5 domain-containing protein [Helcococcus kunzii]QZO75994.1 G5 domain-containing protein [Helcococcus kunzii]